MPVYEYECNACGSRTEAIQKFSDDPLTECVKCGGVLRKLISNTAFVLKGSGWYADGYATPAPPAPKEEKAKAAGNGGNGNKPGTKKDPKKSSKKPAKAEK